MLVHKEHYHHAVSFNSSITLSDITYKHTTLTTKFAVNFCVRYANNFSKDNGLQAANAAKLKNKTASRAKEN